MNSPQKSEKGQILVIFVVALVALLALTALAIDGGMVYADRRFNQSASDAASLAGGGTAAQSLESSNIDYNAFTCTKNGVTSAMNIAETSAITRASSNQFADLDDDLSDNHGVEVTCVNDEAHFDKHIDTRTVITSTVQTAFAQMFFSGPMKNTVESVVRIRPRIKLAFGYAIASLSEDCGTNDGGVTFSGSNTVHIEGGGVFSNSCLNANGTKLVVNVDGGQGIDYVTSYSQSGNPTLNPPPTKIASKMPILPDPNPVCGNGTVKSHSGDGNIGPGNYSQIKLTNGTLTLSPGLYCLTGDVEITGGNFNAVGVTFYMKKDGNKNTTLSINGNATANMRSADSNTATDGAIPGILVYMDRANEGNISLEGTSTSSFYGAIYGPSAEINVGGNSGVNPTYSTQLVGKVVKVHGNAAIDIRFNSFEPYTTPPFLDLIK